MKKRKYSTLYCGACGKKMDVRIDYITRHTGVCLSCQRRGNKNAKKHGGTGSRLYGIWRGLKHRRYKKEISLCEEWRDFAIFKKWAIANGYQDNLTIDRINNNKGYCSENCQWVTRAENARKDRIIFTDEQKIQTYELRMFLNITQSEMCRLLGVSRNTIYRAEKYAKEERNEFISNTVKIESTETSI